MKTLAAFLVAVAAAVAVGILLSYQPGYVLVAYGGTRVEFTLFVFVLIYLAALVLGGLLWSLARRLAGAPARLRRIRETRALRRADRLYTTGLAALAEGRYPLALRALESAARGPLLLPALLAAARAAESAGDRDRRDEYLRRAYEERPQAAPAILIAQADYELALGNNERALAILKRLRSGRMHPALLRKLAETRAALGEHAAIVDMLPELLRQSALPQPELEALAAAALAGVLAADGTDPARERRRIPRALRESAAVTRAAAAAYARRGDARRAGELLEHAAAGGRDGASVRAFAELTALPAAARLRRLEGWLDREAGNPVLLREAARVALELRLWGQARGYLEEAVHHGAGDDVETALLRGRLAEQEGHPGEAAGAYRAALEAGPRRADGG